MPASCSTRRRVPGRLAILMLTILPLAGGVAPGSTSALVFASPDTEPATPQPPNFPYWEYVTQRRYEGPSVIYLGAGFALTARHVGMGEILLEDVIYAPRSRSQHTLLNEEGTAADAIIFELETEPAPPAWPLLPIATSPPDPGEDVLLIGFGRGRDRVVEIQADGAHQFFFTWTDETEKRWGTNRIESTEHRTHQERFISHAFTFDFDPPDSPATTRYEAQAAVGDSGGAVFVERDGTWQLVGMMVSVSGLRERLQPTDGSQGSSYHDRTWVVDLTYYREEILRWTRAACSNERDDDGDDRIDYPQDPGCDSAHDRNERDAWPTSTDSLRIAATATFGIALVVVFGSTRAWRHRKRDAADPR